MTNAAELIIDTNAVDLFNAAGEYEGNIALIDLTADEIRFYDESRNLISEYTRSTFAGVTGVLALDLGRGIYLTRDAVAELQCWLAWA